MPEQQPMDSEKKDKQNWLKRLLQLPQDKRPGDLIAANVEEGARGVAVGKNIVQIGTLIFPTWPFVVVLLLLVLAIVAFGVSRLGPAKMPERGFNVAVAEIGQKDAQGQAQPSEDGQLLSQWIFNGLQQEYKNLPKDAEVHIWHDSLGLTEKRVNIGIISNADEAAKLAGEINADLVIYGNLVTGENAASFAPEFYVNRLRGEAGELDEIQGAYQLGGPISVQTPIDPNDAVLIAFLESKMGFRARVLRWFTIGFIWDLAGQTAKALETFQLAEQDLKKEWPEKNEGKEILYYFIGRQVLFLTRNDEDAQKFFETADEGRNEAEKYFNLALASNSGYARAHMGLGGVYYQRAQRQPPEQRLAASDLEQALGHYQQALADAPKLPGGEQLTREARLGLAVVTYLKGDAHFRLGYYDEAMVYFDWTIREIQSIQAALESLEGAEQQKRSSAHAYLALGNAYTQQAIIQQTQGKVAESVDRYREAQGAYAKCIAQDAPDEIIKNIIYTLCIPYKEAAENACRALDSTGCAVEGGP